MSMSFAWDFASEAKTGDHATQYTGDLTQTFNAPENESVIIPLIIIGVILYVLKGKNNVW